MKKISLKPIEAEQISKDLKKILTVKGHKLSFKCNLILAAIVKAFGENQKAFHVAKEDFLIKDNSGNPAVFYTDELGSSINQDEFKELSKDEKKLFPHQVNKVSEEKKEAFIQLQNEYLQEEFEVNISPIKIELFNQELDNENFSDVELVSLFMHLDKVTEE